MIFRRKRRLQKSFREGAITAAEMQLILSLYVAQRVKKFIRIKRMKSVEGRSNDLDILEKQSE
jgi:hypothetical protein